MPTLTAETDMPVRAAVSASDAPSIFTYCKGSRYRSGNCLKSLARSKRASNASFSDAANVGSPGTELEFAL